LWPASLAKALNSTKSWTSCSNKFDNNTIRVKYWLSDDLMNFNRIGAPEFNKVPFAGRWLRNNPQ